MTHTMYVLWTQSRKHTAAERADMNTNAFHFKNIWQNYQRMSELTLIECKRCVEPTR